MVGIPLWNIMRKSAIKQKVWRTFHGIRKNLYQNLIESMLMEECGHYT